MMAIMRMCSAILTIAYYISAILRGLAITFQFGKLVAIGANKKAGTRKPA